MDVYDKHYAIIEAEPLSGTPDVKSVDHLWFEQNDDRRFLMRRPVHQDEYDMFQKAANFFQGNKQFDMLVVVYKCGGCNYLHRNMYLFNGRCESLNVWSDHETIEAVQLIMAEPDGPGN